MDRLFINYGLDDFDIITPKLKTNLTVSNPIENNIRNGKFKDSVLDLTHLEFDDVYNSWVYSTYSDGDNALQVIDNKLASNNQSVLIIRDSFAGVVTPFLSLQCKNIYAIDIRKSVVGTNIVDSESNYVNIVKPDYIIIIYKTVKTEECYDFN